MEKVKQKAKQIEIAMAKSKKFSKPANVEKIEMQGVKGRE